jgi:uncharacterized membrane protein YfcA
MGKTDLPEVPPPEKTAKRRVGVAFAYALPIGALGGLTGLGGAEFRLPVLVGVLGYPARRAVPLNLAVSLITLTAALASRSTTLSVQPLLPFSSAVLSLIGGAVVAAFFGTALAKRLSNEWLHRSILVLLLGIGGLLVAEGFIPDGIPAFVPAPTAWQVCAGVLFGLLIGMVSSLLGVAGGELIIPTLVFAFGADIKTAGTASLLISLPTVSVGLVRYARQGAFSDRQDMRATVAPMGVGSIIGAVLGGILVGVIAPSVLKVGLGVILMLSALRVFLAVGHTHLKKNQAGDDH